MAGLKEAIVSIKQRLDTITELQHIAVWNNQLSLENEGQIYNFPKPAAFIQAEQSGFVPLLEGFSQSDVNFAIHLVHEQYDAGSGNFEENLTVYDIKAKIVTLLTNFKPSQCGRLMKVNEVQDYEHTNLYHYIINFVTGLIDDAGSAETKQTEITKAPPTDLITEITWQEV